MEPDTMESQRWLPLEANPDVMNQFLKQLGVGSSWQFVDVYGMETELLGLVPRPVCAVLLLFPITDKYEAFKAEEEARIKKYGQVLSPEVYFMTQTISNSCGTIGLIHALANNQKKLTFGSHSTIKKFLDDSKSLNPAQRGTLLERDESIRVTHETSAQEGQSEAPGIDEKVDLHFIAFIEKGGVLYELDGRKAFPINHGSTSTNNLLEDAILVCQTFMKRDPEELRFTVVALAKV